MKYLIPAVLALSQLFGLQQVLAQHPEISPESDMQTGTVTETTEVPGYVYVKLDTPEIWLAVPRQPVSKGDQVMFSGGMEMRDFYSRALDRTFESVLFVQNVKILSRDAGVLHDSASIETESEKRQIVAPVTAVVPLPGEIEAMSGGKTIGEILADPAQLKNKTLSVRAKVLKVNENINGKNWITLSDGTAAGSEDRLLATSSEMVSAGDVVIATGVIGTNIDIGAGYKYAILLEETTFAPGAE